MGWGAKAIALLAALVATLLVGYWIAGSSGPAIPEIDDATAAELRARAIWRACEDAPCPGGPVLVDAGMSGGVEAELARYADEVRSIRAAEADALAPAGERFPDGAILFNAARPSPTVRSDVVGVDVSFRRGPSDQVGRRYLFRWDGTAWVDVSADAVGVPLTTVAS